MSDRIGEGHVEVRLDTTRLARDSQDLERSMQRSMQQTGQKMQQTGRTLTRRVTAPIVAMGGAIVAAAANYESSMNRVGALTGATGDEFDRLGDRAQELGRTTQFSAAQAADAMGFLAMAGFETNEIYDAMPGVLNLAAAGQLELAQAADIASNVLQGMNMEVDQLDHLIDVMAATTTSANTDMRQLGDAMSFVAPVAAGAGVEIEELGAAVGLLGDAGIQGGRAGTTLRMAISSLLGPTGEAATIMRDLGLNVQDAEGNLRPLNEIIDQLAESGATTSEMMQIFGQRAGPGMAALVARGGDALRDFTEDLRESGGTAEEIAERQMEGLNGALARLRSAAEGAAIAVGESGLLDFMAGLAEGAARIFQRLAETNPELLNFVVIAGGIAAAVGPATWAIGGMITGFSRLLTFINPVTIALGAIATVLGVVVAKKSDAAHEAEQLKDQYIALGGATEEATRAIAKNQLMEDGAVQAARDLGIGLDLLVDAAAGVPGAMEEIERKLEDTRNEAAEMFHANEMLVDEWNRVGDAAVTLEDSLHGLPGELREGADAAREQMEAQAELEGKYLDLQHALDNGLHPAHALQILEQQKIQDEAGETGEAVDDLGEDYDGLTESVEDSTNALQDHAEALRRQTDPMFNLISAIEDVTEAEEAFNDALDEHGPKSDDARDAALDLMDAQLDLMGAAGDAQGVYDGQLGPALRRMLDAHGATKEQIDLVEQAFNEAKEAGDDFAGEYHALATVTSERSALLDLEAELSRFAGSTYTATANVRVHGPQTVHDVERESSLHGHRAAGGPVWPGGTFLVGEQGPELVQFGASGFVTPADMTDHMLSGPDVGGLGSPVTRDTAGAMFETATTSGSGDFVMLVDGRELGRIPGVVDGMQGEQFRRARLTGAR